MPEDNGQQEQAQAGITDNNNDDEKQKTQDEGKEQSKNKDEKPRANVDERQRTREDEKHRTKDDDKLSIYKALAIKLKKELVKSRDELASLKRESQFEIEQLKEQIGTLEKALELERVTGTNTSATLEAAVKNYKKQLEVAEEDMRALHIDFENYKTRATEILQQNQSVQSNSNKSFLEERYKQLKSLNEEQSEQIKTLRVQGDELTARIKELDSEISALSTDLEDARAKVADYQSVESHRDRLLAENAALRLAIKQIKEGTQGDGDSTTIMIDDLSLANPIENHLRGNPDDLTSGPSSDSKPTVQLESELHRSMTELSLARSDDDTASRLGATSGSSHNGHAAIKPTPIEIISRTSVLEDAQNRIDVLTKAYLDSESTKSLLIEQVQALKEEIRRLQRGCERIELADNLEYLKNVIFKYLSLDSSQLEQKQRLIPVITTVLKLSPEEGSKLNSLAQSERGSVTGMTTSFFKL